MGDGSLASDLFLPPVLSISNTHIHACTHTLRVAVQLTLAQVHCG